MKKEQTPAERAQMLLDEAQELIEQARALQNGEDEFAAATEKAKLAAAAAGESGAKESVVEAGIGRHGDHEARTKGARRRRCARKGF